MPTETRTLIARPSNPVGSIDPIDPIDPTSATDVLGSPARLPGDWRDHATCRHTDISIFYDSDNERGPLRLRRESLAKAVCAACPVRVNCLMSALTAGEAHGIWGGLTPEERRREIRRRAAESRSASVDPSPKQPESDAACADVVNVCVSRHAVIT